MLVKRSKSNRTESSSVHDMEEQRKSSLDEVSGDYLVLIRQLKPVLFTQFLKYAENVTECRHILICRSSSTICCWRQSFL